MSGQEANRLSAKSCATSTHLAMDVKGLQIRDEPVSSLAHSLAFFGCFCAQSAPPMDCESGAKAAAKAARKSQHAFQHIVTCVYTHSLPPRNIRSLVPSQQKPQRIQAARASVQSRRPGTSALPPLLVRAQQPVQNAAGKRLKEVQLKPRSLTSQISVRGPAWKLRLFFRRGHPKAFAEKVRAQPTSRKCAMQAEERCSCPKERQRSAA